MSQPSNQTTDTYHDGIHLTKSERYELLSVENRRVALRILSEQSGTIELHELATAVVEEIGDSDSADDSDIDRAAAVFHHQHLPKMAEIGVLEYALESRTIEPRCGRITS